MKANSLAECLRTFQTKGSRAPITELLIKIDFVFLSIYTLYFWCYRLSVNLFYTGSEYVVPCLFSLHVDGCFYCTVPPFTASPPSQKTSSKNQKKILCTWSKQRGIRAGHKRSKSHTLHTAVLILFWYTFKMGGPKMRHSLFNESCAEIGTF